MEELRPLSVSLSQRLSRRGVAARAMYSTGRRKKGVKEGCAMRRAGSGCIARSSLGEDRLLLI
jgi:hypothetical protein